MTDLDQTRPAFLTALGSELARVADAERARTRRSRRPRSARTLALAAAATLALAGGAAATTGVGPLPDLFHPCDGPPPAGAPQFTPRDATAEVSPALARRLDVLQRPRTAADSMGEAAAYVSGSGAAPGSSLRVSAPPPDPGTRHATATTVSAWLVPAANGTVTLQMLAPGATGPASGFAADVEMLDRGHARMTLDRDLLGLAPNGVSDVTVTLTDGSEVVLPVVDNVFGAHLDQPVTDVRFGSR
jgi:hypothetical protein